MGVGGRATGGATTTGGAATVDTVGAAAPAPAGTGVSPVPSSDSASGACCGCCCRCSAFHASHRCFHTSDGRLTGGIVVASMRVVLRSRPTSSCSAAPGPSGRKSMRRHGHWARCTASFQGSKAVASACAGRSPTITTPTLLRDSSTRAMAWRTAVSPSTVVLYSRTVRWLAATQSTNSMVASVMPPPARRNTRRCTGRWLAAAPAVA